MGLHSSLLSRPRALALLGLAAVVVAWFELAPRLPFAGTWGSIAIVAAAVMPGTLALVYVALPLWSSRLALPVGLLLVAAAFGFDRAGLGLEANFAKLGAATLIGWAFLSFFEELSWVVLIACVIPFVDAISVWRGPTHAITTHHFHVYTSVAVAFVVPGGRAAFLGPPDILFYALFLAAAMRWRLRVFVSWLAVTGMYSLTIVIAYAVDVGGLPALPFLSFGFLAANADLLWRRLRPARS
ncbi:MAG TPA: hypothetical protein VHD91_04135 [Gaiellaceae bacterium]|nr:hypothetical protein [Gaiellaceae bacterium]